MATIDLSGNAAPVIQHGSESSEASGPQSGHSMRRMSTQHVHNIADEWVGGETTHKDWSTSRVKLAKIMHTNAFEAFMAFALSFNMVLVVRDVDHRANDEETEVWLSICVHSLLVLYCVELAARFYIQRKEKFFESRMNLLDAAVVSADVLCFISEGLIGTLPSLSVLRLIRIIRLVRVVRILTAFKELYLMIFGLGGALKAVLWASVLVCAFLLVWSIVSVEVLNPIVKDMVAEGEFVDCKRCSRAFESVWAAFLTYMQTIIAGDSWGELSLVMAEKHPWTLLIFFSGLMTINLGMLNLVLSVIVDRAESARREDDHRQVLDKMQQLSHVRAKLKEVFRSMDSDSSGSLTWPEILDAYRTDAGFRQMLQLMDVGPEDLEIVYSILDEDRSGSVCYSEFVDQFHKMKTQDSHTLLVFIRHYVNQLRFKVNEQMNVIQTEIVAKMKEQHEDLAGITAQQKKELEAITLLLGASKGTVASPSAGSKTTSDSMVISRSGEQDTVLLGSLSACRDEASVQISNLESMTKNMGRMTGDEGGDKDDGNTLGALGALSTKADNQLALLTRSMHLLERMASPVASAEGPGIAELRQESHAPTGSRSWDQPPSLLQAQLQAPPGSNVQQIAELEEKAQPQYDLRIPRTPRPCCRPFGIV